MFATKQKFNETLLRVKRYLSENNNVQYDFHSTQIDIPTDVHITDLFYNCQYFIKDENLYHDGNKYGRENEIHITVCYGLVNENDYFKLRQLIQNFGSIEIQLGGISKFTSDTYDVIKIDIISDKLHDLNKLIRDNFEVKSTYNEYTPHLTLAYVKPNSCDSLLTDESVSSGVYQFGNIMWSHIDGYKLEIPLN